MKKYADISTYLAAGLQFIFGLVYLIRNKFMPYHEEAAGLSWDKVDAAFQYLFIAGMKIAGVGFVMSSAVIAFLQYKFGKDKISWIPGLVVFIGTMSYVGSMSAILIVKINTPGHPPYLLATLGWILVLLGFYCNRKWSSNNQIN